MNSTDVVTVLEAHGVPVDWNRLEEISELLDQRDIEIGELYYDTPEDKLDSRLSDIEDQFMSNSVIPKSAKVFSLPVTI